jgi:hypothetical protein
LISRTARTEPVDHRTRLAGVSAQHADPLTPRLFHLARWLGKLLNDPALAWWVAAYHTLHPTLLNFIERQLERDANNIHKVAYRVWTLLLEHFHRSPDDSFDRRWYQLAPRLKREGWTPQALREFERVTQPYLTSSRPSFGQPSPPVVGWDRLRLRDVVRFKVQFPNLDQDNLTVPSEKLSDIFRILRRGLEQASSLLADIETTFWRTATFHPENKPGEVHLDDEDQYLRRVVTLCDRLATEYPDLARMEVKRWPTNDDFFFDKLRIYAWIKRDLLSGDEVASGLISLTDAGFWDSNHRRELLHTLRERWIDLDPAARAQIESRIIAGPARWNREDDADYATRKAITPATVFGWLERHGCELSSATHGLLRELREADSRWQPAWDEAADESNDPRGGSIQTKSDPSKIIDVPVADLIGLAEQYTTRHAGEFTEYDPFQGLVEQRPRRALAALSYEVRRGRFPQKFWQTMISHWPHNTSERLRWTLAHRLVRLPTPVVSELRYYIPDWFRKNLPPLAQSTLPRALNLWDQLFEHFLAAGADATRSSLGDTFIRGEAQHRSRRTYGHAINSPIGRMVATLLEILRLLELNAGAGIPAQIRSRLERTLSAPGEGKDHAISELATHLTLLHYLDPDWVRQRLISFFDPTHLDSEPAWSGYAHDSNQAAGPELFTLLKPHFLIVFRFLTKWHWDDNPQRRFTELVVVYCFWHLNDGRYISYNAIPSRGRRRARGTCLARPGQGARGGARGTSEAPASPPRRCP